MFIRLLLFFAITFINVNCYSQSIEAKKNNVNPKARALNDSAVNLVINNVQYDKAIDLLDQALQIDSNYLSALYHKFSYEYTIQRYNQAIITAQHILRLQPQPPYFYTSVASLYFHSGDSISANKFLQVAEIKINSILDTMKMANSEYNDLLLNKAVVFICKDSLHLSDSILSLLITNAKDSDQKDAYSQYLHITREKFINDIFNSTQSTTMGSSEAMPAINIDTVKFYGKKDIRKYKFQPGFYLLKEDHRKSKGLMVSDTNQYYFIAKSITIPLSGVDSVSKIFSKHFKKFELNFCFNDSGVKELYDFTTKCLNHKVGILINNKLMNAVNVLMPIEDGKLTLSGSKLSEQEIDNLMQSIRNEINKQEPVKK